MPKAELGNEDLLGLVELVDRALISLRKLHRAADDGGQHSLEFERRIHCTQHLFQRLELCDGSAELIRACAATPGMFPR